MNSHDFSADVQSVLANQPHEVLYLHGSQVLLLGTAHVSRQSVEAVAILANHSDFDAIAVELCAHRAQSMRNPDQLAEMDLLAVLREGRAGVIAAGLALSAFQRRIAEQFGIEPGAELKAALLAASDREMEAELVDRDVGLTLRRARARLSWWGKLNLTSGLVASLVSSDEIAEEDIEKLKQGGLLTSAFTEFAQSSPDLFDVLIAERDQFMAARVTQIVIGKSPQRLLVIVGAGHLSGMAQALNAEQPIEAVQRIDELSQEPPKSSLGKWLGYGLIAFILAGFAFVFSKDVSVGWDLLLFWTLATGIGGAIGATAAKAHPYTVLIAFLVSPITPIHPLLASGMVCAATELWIRKPKVGDFAAIRDDVMSIKGWWKNKVTRIILVFFLTSLGTSIGVYIAGFKIAGQVLS